MNLDYEKDNMRFNARVSAIIYNREEEKILLFKIKDRDYFMLPGGRLEFYEDSLTAIKREIYEELGYNLNFEFCSIQENFVEIENKKIMQYCFCYKAIYKDNINDINFVCKDNSNQTFFWIDIDDLSKYNILPKSTYNLIKNSKNITHIIEK